MPCRLYVGAQEFTLSDEHATAVAEEILTTIDQGRGYVHLTPLFGAPADVLITAAIPVTFQVIPSPEPEPGPVVDTWAAPEEYWPDDYS